MSWAESASAREAREEPWAGRPDPEPPRAVPMRVALPPPDPDEPRVKGGTRHIKILFGLAAVLLLAGGAVHAAFGSAPPSRGPVTRTGPHMAPDKVTVTRHGASVVVSWHDPSDGAAVFRVDGGVRDGATTIHRDVPAGVTTAIITPLDAGTSWCFTVTARYTDTMDSSPVACLPR